MSYSIPRSYLLSGVILVLAGFVYWEAENIPSLTTDLSVVDAAFFPTAIAILLAVLALMVAWQGRNNTSDRIVFTLTPAFRKAALFVGIMIAYALALPTVGFELSSLTFLMLTMWLLGMRSKVLAVVLSVMVTSLIYIIFINLMYVPIPSLLKNL